MRYRMNLVSNTSHVLGMKPYETLLKSAAQFYKSITHRTSPAGREDRPGHLALVHKELHKVPGNFAVSTSFHRLWRHNSTCDSCPFEISLPGVEIDTHFTLFNIIYLTHFNTLYCHVTSCISTHLSWSPLGRRQIRRSCLWAFLDGNVSQCDAAQILQTTKTSSNIQHPTFSIIL